MIDEEARTQRNKNVKFSFKERVKRVLSKPDNVLLSKMKRKSKSHFTLLNDNELLSRKLSLNTGETPMFKESSLDVVSSSSSSLGSDSIKSKSMEIKASHSKRDS